MKAASRFVAGSLSVVLVIGLTGCQRRLTGSGTCCATPATVATTAPTPSATPSAAESGSVSQQDINTLQGILSSADSAVTTARSAIAGDTATP